MNQQDIIQSLRAEIAKLQRVLDLLLDQSTIAEEVRRPGRPKGSAKKATSFHPEEFAPKKRTMSAEGKTRIIAAQKRRWAAQKTASPARVQRKQTPSTQKPAASVRTRKTALKKTASKKTKRPATKPPAKQVASATAESQATA